MAFDMSLDEDRLTAEERRRLNEQRRLNFQQDMRDAAHNRFMQGRAGFIERNPGAVSPEERDSVLSATSRDGAARLRRHEKDMLRQQGENEFRVAEQKRLGMENQGVGAANARGAWDFKVEQERGKNALDLEKERGSSALTLEERRIAGQKDIADIDAGVKRYGFDKGLETEKARQEGETGRARLEHGYYNEYNIPMAGSRERVAKIQSDAAEKEAARAREERIAQTQAQLAQKSAQAREDNIRKQMNTMAKDSVFAKLPPEEQRKRAMRALGLAGGLSEFEE